MKNIAIRPMAAIVGAGMMGRWHAFYATRAGAAVGAIVDPDQNSAARLRRRYPRATVFADLESCIEKCPVVVVHMCTPPSCHAPLVRLALDAGKHVLAEKPLACSRADTEKLAEVAARRGRQLAITHQYPFQRGFRRLQEQRVRLGRLLLLSATICSNGGAGLSPFARKQLLLEILPHPLSVIRALMKVDVSSLAWHIADFSAEAVELTAYCHGTRLAVHVNLSARPPRSELNVFGSEASAHVDFFHGYSVIEPGMCSRSAKIYRPIGRGIAMLSAAAANLARRAVEREPAYPGLLELIRLFYQSLNRSGPAPVAVEEAIEIATVIERIRRAEQLSSDDRRAS